MFRILRNGTPRRNLRRVFFILISDSIRTSGEWYPRESKFKGSGVSANFRSRGIVSSSFSRIACSWNDPWIYVSPHLQPPARYLGDMSSGAQGSAIGTIHSLGNTAFVKRWFLDTCGNWSLVCGGSHITLPFATSTTALRADLGM